MHPMSPETFYIIEGEYEFMLSEKSLMDKSGDTIFFPKGTPHRFEVGRKGGHALIMSPPELEHYFFKVGELFSKGKVSYKTESNIAEQYGQTFLDNRNHWK